MRLSSLPFLLPLLALASTESPPNGLVVTTIKEAKTCPRAAKAGDRLRVHYEGRLDGPDGKMFDSSKERGNTFNFQLGAGQVITR